MKPPFTGRHMALVMVGGFGIVIAVNLSMAALAVGGFSGVVVKNSYVASQQFNGWLDSAATQDALGWDIAASRMEDGTVMVTMQQVPVDATLSAAARRPLGEPDHRTIVFSGNPVAGFRSTQPLPAGRWLLRISVVSADHQWRSDGELQ